MKLIALLLLTFGYASSLFSQTSDSTFKSKTFSNIEWSGYLEMYVGTDFRDNRSHERPSFLSNETRTDELALNLALLKAQIEKPNYRAHVGLMSGTYVERNMSNEPVSLKHLYEANLGFRLSNKRQLWLDAGILPSHIGLETAIGKDNPTLTRSIIAENSPYFETGVRASYTSPSEKWYFAALVLNGWQNIQKHYGNYLPAFGGQITYQPTAKLLINYSNYLGDQSSSKSYYPRLFHDVYITYAAHSRLKLFAGYDYGNEPIRGINQTSPAWSGWITACRVQMLSKLAICLRAEGYNDKNEIIIDNPFGHSFSVVGFSVNTDFQINDFMLARLEFRHFESKNTTFSYNTGVLSNQYNGLTVALCDSL